MMRRTYDPDLSPFSPSFRTTPDGKCLPPPPYDLTCNRCTYTANLQWNWVSNLESSGAEAEALPLDHMGTSQSHRVDDAAGEMGDESGLQKETMISQDSTLSPCLKPFGGKYVVSGAVLLPTTSSRKQSIAKRRTPRR
ncbi:hypothetical protein AVEN_225723-1 [Araneus ventricosus]|uniref:Uncharacterized protein n=1 Tax=Araneus ventricosus TaxID=182803 RepID=A0A4Y2PA11_ARAVE|nr:hypothetical protein AVEN_225723-1 [Araneus ventricosus]